MRQADERARQAEDALRQEMAEMSGELRENISQLSQEIKQFKQEGEKQRRHLNKKMAEMSNKMGTLTEDLIAPSIPRILAEIVNCVEEPELIGVGGLKKGRPGGGNQEYDALAVCGDYVLICEAKSRLRPEQVREFRKKLADARKFMPEYADKKIIGALGTFYVDPTLIKHGARQGLIMLGVIDGLMNILNEKGFVPEAF